MTTRTDVSAAIALLIAEATLFFTFLFVVGPIAMPARLVPLAAVLVLCAALYWGQNWARWALLAPIGVRVWRLVPLTAAAWGLGRPGFALFLTLIILVELAAAFILLDRYLRSFSFPQLAHKNAVSS
jgi:glucan phosphoethanolaminetransferase (alkaline phosphatase superfamily)